MAMIGDRSVQHAGEEAWVSAPHTVPRSRRSNQKQRAGEEAWVSAPRTVLRPDIAEVYSPPRVTASAAEHGLLPGWSLDLTFVDANGVA